MKGVNSTEQNRDNLIYSPVKVSAIRKDSTKTKVMSIFLLTFIIILFLDVKLLAYFNSTCSNFWCLDFTKSL